MLSSYGLSRIHILLFNNGYTEIRHYDSVYCHIFRKLILSAYFQSFEVLFYLQMMQFQFNG